MFQIKTSKRFRMLMKRSWVSLDKRSRRTAVTYFPKILLPSSESMKSLLPPIWPSTTVEIVGIATPKIEAFSGYFKASTTKWSANWMRIFYGNFGIFLSNLDQGFLSSLQDFVKWCRKLVLHLSEEVMHTKTRDNYEFMRFAQSE